MSFTQSTSVFLWIFILIDFSNIDNQRNRKWKQKVLLTYVNGINIINIVPYKIICGEKEWAWGEVSNKEIETDFFQSMKE